jgi:excisionase family DNA binding protein
MTTPPDDLEFLTVAEAAALVRLPERTISRMLKTGKLPGIFAGTRNGWRIRRDDLMAWSTNMGKQPKEEPTNE